MKDKNGLNYARKSMIRTGLALNTNGQWEEAQLSQDLQSIVAKYRVHFDGTPVTSDLETDTVQASAVPTPPESNSPVVQ